MKHRIFTTIAGIIGVCLLLNAELGRRANVRLRESEALEKQIEAQENESYARREAAQAIIDEREERIQAQRDARSFAQLLQPVPQDYSPLLQEQVDELRRANDIRQQQRIDALVPPTQYPVQVDVYHHRDYSQ